MKYTLFPGCKVPYFVPYYETSSRAILERFGIALTEQEFACCGYPIRFLDFQAFIYSSARNLALAGEKGRPLLCLCQCCYGTLRYADLLLRKNETLFRQTAALLKEEGLRYPGQLEIKHLLHVFLEDIDPAVLWKSNARPFKSLKVAVHYGCHLLRPRDVTAFDHPANPSKFETLVEVTGGISVDWSLRLQCCGDPLREKNDPLSAALRQKKMDSAREAEADVLCVACPHCQMQFARPPALAEAGTAPAPALPSLLYTQLLGLSLGLDEKLLGPIGFEKEKYYTSL
ncbi:MAG: CoB--CoM heterodisulfide reductase iron-sulfur subunit B family protein [Desulfobacterota bacterium]|jgi:heterodisulfide reductase subunit B|nr:CoB--CoM heterodisulfide reductase iron-sulfur subunit B family protein [Thermodesulfobacteriota bacterium]